MKRKQERRKEVKETKGNRGSSPQATRAATNNAMTLSVAEEANIFSAGDNRACSDGRGRKDKYGSSMGVGIGNGGFSKMGPLCDEGRQREELLCLQGFEYMIYYCRN